MDAQLQGLIDQIKEEGVAVARKESVRIVDEANAQAAQIREDARREADAMLVKAREESDRFRESSGKALEQAARNLVLGLRGEIEKTLQAAVRGKVGEALTPAALKDILVRLVGNWAQKGDTRLEVLLNEADRQQLEAIGFAALSAKMRSGVELKPTEGVRKGFMVGETGTGAYYDVTDEGITEVLSVYLNPRLRELLEKAVRK